MGTKVAIRGQEKHAVIYALSSFPENKMPTYVRKKRLTFVIIFITLQVVGLFLYSYSGERGVLLRRMIKQPRLVGSIAPSSESLANFMVKEVLSIVELFDGMVVEIGPGTGCITRVLLEHGIAAERLVCIEADPELHQYMTEQFPNVRTILGDAIDLKNLLPEKCGEIVAVISGVPLKNIPLSKEKDIIQACCAMLRPCGKLIQFTYGVRPPSITSGLDRTFAGFVLLNLPPAFVWSFTKEK